jgi:hypothetical protein
MGIGDWVKATVSNLTMNLVESEIKDKLVGNPEKKEPGLPDILRKTGVDNVKLMMAKKIPLFDVVMNTYGFSSIEEARAKIATNQFAKMLLENGDPEMLAGLIVEVIHEQCPEFRFMSRQWWTGQLVYAQRKLTGC